MNVLLGVTGSIACYKVCGLIRDLVSRGHSVRVVATKHALDFVGEITWRTLSQHVVERDAFAESPDWHPRHIELATWCDLFVVAPCSADTLARVANGFANDLLSQCAVALPAGKPFLLAPSMNVHMWSNPAVRHNVEVLTARGAQVLSPGEGELACGVSGSGRLPEPEDLLRAIEACAK